MAILEANTDLDVKGRLLATDVPNSTGSIVTWNANTNVFGLRTDAQILSDIGAQPVGNYVPTSRTITAGNGLSGGGNLTANRTITLGTPGSIGLTSTNGVTTSSHTHALDSATTTAINQGVTAHGWGDWNGKTLSLDDASTDLIENVTIDANNLNTAFTYLNAASSNIPSTPNGGYVLSGKISSGYEAQMYMGSNNDSMFYRSGKLTGTTYGDWYHMASREWVNSQGYLTSTPTLQEVLTAGNQIVSSIRNNPNETGTALLSKYNPGSTSGQRIRTLVLPCSFKTNGVYTGQIIIKRPLLSGNRMYTFDISMYHYSQSIAAQLKLCFYENSGDISSGGRTGIITATDHALYDELIDNNIRAATNNNEVMLILGNPDFNWNNHIHIVVDQVTIGHSGASQNALESGWEIVQEPNDISGSLVSSRLIEPIQRVASRDWVTSQNYLTSVGWTDLTGSQSAINLSGFNDDLDYDNYGSWNLKTNGVQRTTVQSGGNLDLVAGTDINLSYSAGGTVTIANTAPNATHTGDVTGSTALTIANNAVTFAKMQNIATQRFLGRVSSGTGNVEALTTAQMQSALGYLTSFTETDPTVPTHVKAITATNISNWNTAYGWGNHNTQGYLTSVPTATATVDGTVKLFSNTIQSVAANAVSATASRTYGIQLNSSGQAVVNVPWTNSTYSLITEAQIISTTSATARLISGTRLHYWATQKGLTDANIANWNTAYGWGNHASQGYLTSLPSHSINTHSDVNITTPSNGQVLKYDNGSWVNVADETGDNNYVNSISFNTGTGVLTLGRSGLSDLTEDLDGRYSLESHNHTLDSLSNVTITSNTSGEILKWDGSAWINNTLAQAGIASSSHTHANLSTGTGLTGSTYNGGTARTFAFDTAWGDARYALDSHTHSASDITSGTISYARLPFSSTDVGNWNTAFGWGDHATEGYLTSNQTITLSGDVSGSGSTSIAVTIASNAVEAGMLNNNIISGKTALTSGLASTDELMISDAGVIKRMDVSVLQTYMQSNLAFTNNSGTVTSVATGTGLTGGTITGSGTISINTQTLSDIALGVTAHGWGNHASQGYLTSVPDNFVTKDNISSSALATTVIDFDSAGNGASILYAGASSTNTPSVSGTAGGLLIRGNHSSVGEYQMYLARGENDALLYRNQSGSWNRAASRKWVETRGYLTSLPSHNLDFHSDVEIASPSNGQVLTYGNGVWKNASPGGGGSNQTLQQVLVEGDSATRSIFMDDTTSISPRYSFSGSTGTGMYSRDIGGVRYLSFAVGGKGVIEIAEGGIGVFVSSYINTPAEPLTSSADVTNNTSSILSISAHEQAKWILRGNFTGNRTVRINNLKKGGEIKILLVNLSTTVRQFTIQASETTSGWSTCHKVFQSGYSGNGYFSVAAYDTLSSTPGAMLISVMNFNGTFVATKISD